MPRGELDTSQKPHGSARATRNHANKDRRRAGATQATSARRRGEHEAAEAATQVKKRAPKAAPPKKRAGRSRVFDPEANAADAAHAQADDVTTDSLQLFFNAARRYPLLTAAQEIELAKRIEKGDMEAKDRMINSNLRLLGAVGGTD